MRQSLPQGILGLCLVCAAAPSKRRNPPADAVRISAGVYCLPNPPDSERLCHYSQAVTRWLHELAVQKLELDRLTQKKQKRARRAMERSACIGQGGSLPPLRRKAGYRYDICTFQVLTFKDNSEPFKIFFPSDDQDKIAECDVLPWLMNFATNGTPGLAIDIGAGDSGSCSWPLLSEGHEVHMFEPGYSNPVERSFVELTRDLNGWQHKATLHGAVGGDPYVAQLFEKTSRIHLLKIDVDDRQSYEAVFAGVAPVLHKVDILQIEMIDEEIGRHGMTWIMDTFLSHDFLMFGLEDVDTFPGFQHDSLGRGCQDGDMPSTMHSEPVIDGEVEYEYGMNGPGKLRMFPICRCEGLVLGRGRGSKDPLACNAQFAFVRRGSAALAAVQRRYGSCEARQLFSEASQRWWQLLAHRSAESFAPSGPRASGAESDEVTHIAMVASVGFPAFGRKALAGLRSALFFASRPLRLHLVVDRLGEQDLREAIETLEPSLRAKGSFRFYRQEELQTAWREINALVPPDCLQFSGHYGDAGWLRMFPHLVIPESEAVDALIWVDAGDFVFLEDPVELARHRENFDEDDFLGVADEQVLGLPLQLFSLRRLRSHGGRWAELVTDAVHRGYAESGDSFCRLGEGMGVVFLLHHAENRWVYYQLPHHWTYMPWAVWLPSTGTGSLWASRSTLWRLPADPVWSDSVFPGLSDFTTLRVRCPSFLEELASYIRVATQTDMQELSPDEQAEQWKHFRVTRDAVIVDEFEQRLGCEERAKAVHLPVMFHQVPWVHRFLNFWAGAEVWTGGAPARELRTDAMLDMNAASAAACHALHRDTGERFALERWGKNRHR
ncbi:unnamed protein product [Effrenium voratum]|uniref:Uncharacterized protein n=1 Tax=Effrenium voratum TaxID=2562239 RepID=A0AA36I966_9DINO|nr:unnamed protein product [Effrenium voratum]